MRYSQFSSSSIPFSSDSPRLELALDDDEDDDEDISIPK
jgi:hypothetical protein